MSKNIFNYLIFLSVVGLASCGGSESKKESNNSVSPTASSLIAQDVIKTVWITEAKVALQSAVISSNISDELTLTDVIPKKENASQCDNVEINKDDLSFVVQNANSVGVCIYEYTVSSSTKSSSTGTSIVSLVEPESSRVTPEPNITNESLNLGESHTIQLEVPDGMSLSNEISIIGHGTLIDTNMADNTVTYQAGILASDVGVSKIYYHSFNNDSVQLGVVNVAVSNPDNSDTNHLPGVTNFSYATDEDMNDGLTYTSIKVGETVQIDLEPYVWDDDLDDVQLIEVQSFNANATPSNPEDMNNLKFDFSSESSGLFDVSYTISDHHGGFATGIVQIKVISPYFDTVISETGDVFAAPLTYNGVVNAGLSFSSTAEEDIIPFGNGIKNVPLYTWSQADLICRARGGVLPSVEQWQHFSEQEGNPFTDDTDLDSGSLNWPIQHSYFTSTTVVGDDNMIQVYDPVTFEFSDASKETQAYIACVDFTPKSLEIDPLIYLVKGEETQLSLTFSTLGGSSFPYTKEVYWDYGAPSSSSLDDVNEPDDVTTLTQEGKVTVLGDGWLNISATATTDSTLTSNMNFYSTDNILNVGGADLSFNADNDNSSSTACQRTTIANGATTESGFIVTIGDYGQQLQRLDNCDYDLTEGTETFYHFKPSEQTYAQSQVSMTMPNEFQFKLTPGTYRMEADIKFEDQIEDAATVRLKLTSGIHSYVCTFDSGGALTTGSGSMVDSAYGNGWQHGSCTFTVLTTDTSTYRLQITGGNTHDDTTLTSFYIDNVTLLPNR